MRYTDEQKAEAVKAFLELKAAGKPVREIQKQLGITHGALYKWIRLAKQNSRKLTTPPKDIVATAIVAAEKNTGGYYPAELKDMATQMLASGMRQVDVARRLGVSAQAVQYWLKTRLTNGVATPAPEAKLTPAKAIGSGGAITDALIYLRHAETEIMEMVREGKISRPDQAHLLTLLALGALQKAIAK